LFIWTNGVNKPQIFTDCATLGASQAQILCHFQQKPAKRQQVFTCNNMLSWWIWWFFRFPRWYAQKNNFFFLHTSFVSISKRAFVVERINLIDLMFDGKHTPGIVTAKNLKKVTEYELSHCLMPSQCCSDLWACSHETIPPFYTIQNKILSTKHAFKQLKKVNLLCVIDKSCKVRKWMLSCSFFTFKSKK
jgi:hypothetical protein